MFAAIMMIVSTLATAYSQIQQGKAEKKAQEYNAQVAENQAEWAKYEATQAANMATEQARWAEYNAVLATDEATRKADKHARETKLLLGKQKALYGKAGIQLTGTPLDVMTQTQLLSDYDESLLVYEGDLDAWNFRKEAFTKKSAASAALISGANEASVQRSAAAMNRAKGAQAGRSGYLNAGSTILTGATDVAPGISAAWKNYKSKSLLPNFG